MVLSSAARSVWAKSLNDDGAWLPLWQHMDDSSDIAGGLFDGWLSPSVIELLASPFGGDVAAARTGVTLLAGLHDLGKATPAFAVQDQVLAQRMREHGLEMPTTKELLVDRRRVYHSLAGHQLLSRWLVHQGWSKGLATTWAVVLGGHHGVPPDAFSLTGGNPAAYPKLYGQGVWEEVQRELTEHVAARTGACGYLDVWREVELPAQFQVLTTGLVIISDWIASNETLLPFLRARLPEASEKTGRGRWALDQLALLPPWRPVDIPDTVDDLFAARFQLPEGAGPRPAQRAACEVIMDMSAPGLVIIEAPMGEGKTEAALAAAEIMTRRWGAGGLQVALPTQATTDAMFDRVMHWLDTMGEENQTLGAITLSHGKARLNRVFQGVLQAGRLAEIGCDEGFGLDRRHHLPHAVVAHSWLSGRKKSQLANFVVGTIDQVLFAGLKSRHLMLRHLALAGKIVLLDEVHAYDVFMNSYLTRVLTWLGAYRVPVIALSATLPPERRRVLLSAYQRGWTGDRPPQAAGPSGQVSDDGGYPVISWTAGADVQSRNVAPSSRKTTVSIAALGGGAEDDLDALTALLQEALSDGGCALVVRNTVRRVLRTADFLKRSFADEVTVAHSRFIAADRLRNDEDLLDRFGPPSRALDRPFRRIVVASQVVEQSLDIDFDLLITDLAPVDLILQRMGRLHRHARGKDQSDRPPKLRSARTYITGADFTDHPPALERGASRYVYGAYPLLCAAAVLVPRFGSTIQLPDDIPVLVNQAYGQQINAPDSWSTALEDAHCRWLEDTTRRTENAKNFQISDPPRAGTAILGWISASVGEADDESQGQGQVRDGPPSVEAILVQQSQSGDWFTPDWLPDGQGRLPVPQDRTPSDDLASIMAACTVRLPLQLSDDASERALWSVTPEPWIDSPLIYRLPVVVIGDDGLGAINGRRIRYTQQLGLEVFDS
jgi:CRISPR-associated endonuclease/helicase Cas3